MSYDLPARSIRLPGAVQYDCPLSTCTYNFCLPLSDAQLGITMTMRLWGENSEEMQVGAELMQDHVKTHFAWEFLDSLAKEEQDFENAIGLLNEKVTNADRDKARAWENAQGVQESLQRAREELADTRLALSETVGVLGRVKGILAEVAGMPADSYQVVTNFALVQQLVQPFDPMAPELPEQVPFTRCASTTFCAGWGFCSKCHPALTDRAGELYRAQGEQSSQAYARAVAQAAKEMGVEVPAKPDPFGEAPDVRP